MAPAQEPAMQPHELVTHFQRFRRRGDPRALGAVFDATAPELLRTAVHLVGDASLAEDAVQETFRVAIERRDEYDEARPLVPWLAGILANQARSARRRRPRGSGPDENLAAPDRDPSRRVGEREVDELVQAAIDSLPEDYRQVLTLNLRHGLAPAEVAHALGLSPSTVRSRLARGRERLRDRLPAEAALSAAFAAPALRGLDDVRADVLQHAAAVAPPVTVTLASMVVAMKLLVPAAVIAGAATLWWSADSSEAPIESVAAASSAVTEPSSLEAAELSTEPLAEPHLAAEAEREVVYFAVPQTGVESEPAAPVQPHEHTHEYRDIEFVVVDAYDVPVPDAEIRFRSMRSESSAWGWSLEPASVVTDTEGHARLRLPDQQFVDMPIQWFRFDVLHPRFAPLQHEAAARSGTVRLVLEPGVFVIATGWIGSPDNVVADVVVTMDDASKLAPQDWTPLRDGRLACSRLQSGPHVLFLAHEDGDGRKWFSRLVDVELAAGEQRELHVELHPARQVRGMLDPVVPRPVEHGRVAVAFHNARAGWEAPGVFDMRTVEVAADGSFVLEGAPPHFLDVVAVCDGWTSTRIPPSSDCGREGSLHQFAPEQLANELLVPMHPAAALEVTFVDPDGRPLPDASVTLHPNVRWNAGFSTILFGESRIVRSDASGRAFVPNLTPGVEWGTLNHSDYEFAPGAETPSPTDRPGRQHFELVSGETLRFEARMVPKSPR